MSLPRYPEYKGSGLPWVPDVPSHWLVSPLKRIAELKSGNGITSEEIEDDGDFAVYGGNGVRGYTDRFTHDGEFALIGRQGALCGNINYAKGRFWASEHAVVVTPVERIETRWLGELLRSMNLNQYSVSAAQPGLSVETISNHRIPVPPLDEQRAIATFLGRETAKIDALIAEQEKLLALLAEKRQATISHAVTSGLNPNAPMKDSGIPWLGKVPAHWEVRSISSVSTKITNGYVGPTRDLFVDEGIRYLQSLHIKGNHIQFDPPYFVRQEWSEQHGKSMLEVGDVLIVQTGDIGQSAVVTEEFAGCNCHALIIVAPLREQLDGRWLSWVLNSDYGIHSLLSIQTGALHPHLNCGNVKGLYVPLPPLEEQARIVEYIDDVGGRYKAMSDDVAMGIDLLGERRSALISAAVTGKVDVRQLK